MRLSPIFHSTAPGRVESMRSREQCLELNQPSPGMHGVLGFPRRACTTVLPFCRSAVLSSSAETPRLCGPATVQTVSTGPSRCVCGTRVGPFLRVCPRILSSGPHITSIRRTHNRMFSPHSFSRFLIACSAHTQSSPDRGMSPATISPLRWMSSRAYRDNRNLIQCEPADKITSLLPADRGQDG